MISRPRSWSTAGPCASASTSSSPFMVFDRVPWYANGSWLMPLLIASFAALLLTVLLWPVAAIVRRRYQAPLALDAGSMSAYRWSRIGSVAIVCGTRASGVCSSSSSSMTLAVSAGGSIRS